MGLLKKTAAAAAVTTGVVVGIPMAEAAKDLLDNASESAQDHLEKFNQATDDFQKTVEAGKGIAKNGEAITDDVAEVTEVISKPFAVTNQATDWLGQKTDDVGDAMSDGLERLTSLEPVPPSFVEQLEPHVPVPELPGVVPKIPDVISDPGSALEDFGISF